MKRSDDKRRPEQDVDGLPIDTGYAWVIAFACMFINVIVLGLQRAYGILFVEFLVLFQAPVGMTSLLLTVQAGVTSVAALLTQTVLLSVLSERQTTMLGGLCGGLGLCLSYFDTSFAFLICTQSVLLGLSHALIKGPSYVIVNKYFRRHRSFAMAIAAVGGNFGSMLMPVYTETLLEWFGIRGGLLVLGATYFNIMVAASFLIPLSRQRRRKGKDSSVIMEDQTPLSERVSHHSADARLSRNSIDSDSSAKLSTSAHKTYASEESPAQNEGPEEPVRNGCVFREQNEIERREYVTNKDCDEITHQENNDRVTSTTPNESWTNSDENTLLTEKNVPKSGITKEMVTDSSDIAQPSQKIGRERTTTFDATADLDGVDITATNSEMSARNATMSDGMQGDSLCTSRSEKGQRKNHDVQSDSDDNDTSKSNSEKRPRKRHTQGAKDPNTSNTQTGNITGTANSKDSKTKCTQDSNITGTPNPKDPHSNQTQDSNNAGTLRAEDAPRKSLCRNLLATFDLSLFRKPAFLVVLASMPLATVPAALFGAYLPALAADQGIPRHQVPLLITTFGACGLVSRLGFGFLADRNYIPRPLLLALLTSVNCAAGLLTSVYDTFGKLLAFSVIYGVFGLIVFSLIPVCVVDLMGMQDMVKTLGFTQLFQEIFLALSHPAVGNLRDFTGSYDASYSYLSVSGFSASIILGLFYLTGWLKKRKARNSRKDLEGTQGIHLLKTVTPE